MFCPTCGASGQLGLSCTKCASPLAVATPMVMPTRTSGMAIAGFVLAFCCSVIGIIVSWLALDEIKRSRGGLGGEGLARAGLWLSIIFTILGGLVIGAR